ncbi:MAG: translation elongation factor Ts [Anaerolineae bacterium]|nr:translation elongation factor Ts [Anaerolineae bacterium]MDX9830538.1 translation elongation factor Ts [Anaerolineae bacterium]
MANISAQMVKDLRQETGAGVLDCKQALELHGGDFAKAAAWLREKGMAAAAKRSEREAREGIIGSYIHAGSKVAALVELNCETDFVARTPDFQELAHDLAMQVVAARPLYLSPETVPAEAVEERKALFQAEIDQAGKTGQVAERIMEGKLNKWYDENCLLLQPFIKNPDLTVGELVKQRSSTFGENLIVRRFARLEVGES